MAEPFDRDRVVGCMFDPVTSSILASLEDGPRECSALAAQESIPEPEVLERLSYLIECGFVIHGTDGGGCTLSADAGRLASLMEDPGNFDGAISGLEKMDSYLN